MKTHFSPSIQITVANSCSVCIDLNRTHLLKKIKLWLFGSYLATSPQNRLYINTCTLYDAEDKNSALNYLMRPLSIISGYQFFFNVT